MNIKELIEKEICPVVDSVISPDGDMYVLKYQTIENKYNIRIVCKSTVDSYFQFNSVDDVCSFNILCTDETEQYKVYGGEGSYGSEGVIYLFDKVNRRYVWLLHLNSSNPFVKINICDNKILASNNNGEQWIIPVRPIPAAE
jgi:hypothetical protein